MDHVIHPALEVSPPDVTRGVDRRPWQQSAATPAWTRVHSGGTGNVSPVPRGPPRPLDDASTAAEPVSQGHARAGIAFPADRAQIRQIMAAADDPRHNMIDLVGEAAATPAPASVPRENFSPDLPPAGWCKPGHAPSIVPREIRTRNSNGCFRCG